jgi:hypothetical protein
MFIHRSSGSGETRQIGIEAFEKTITSELENRTQRKNQIIDQLKPVFASENALINVDPTARSALKALEPLLEEKRLKFKEHKRLQQQDRLRTLSLTTHGGLSVSVPPYDTEWKSSFLADADRDAGTFKAMSIDGDGSYVAAGVGLFVSTTIEENVRFSADATFHITWSNLIIQSGAAHSEGGIGVLVYEGGNVIARNDAQLWDDFPAEFQGGITGNSGDEFIRLTDTSAGHTYFHMIPGRQYLVWIWGWTRTNTLGASVFAGGIIDAHVPFVVLAQN